MRNKKLILRTLIFTLFFVGLIPLSACKSPPDLTEDVLGEKLEVRITGPQDGSEWLVGVPITIRSAVSAPNPIVGITLYINNEQSRPEDLFSHPTFTRGFISQIWTPEETGTFTLQTLLRDSQDFVKSNIVTIHIIESAQTKLTPSQQSPFPGEITSFVTSTPTTTLTPTETLTQTLTLTPESEKHAATANQNLNCRRGPDTAYESLWHFLQGETVNIEGRNTDSSWLVISRSDGGGQCWVSSYYIQIEGEISTLPVITPPPLPVTHTATITPTLTATVTEMPYTSCSDYPDLTTCNQDLMGFGGCSWSTGLNLCQDP